MSNVETQKFEASNNILYHLVYSQAGTAAKAIGELVMNAQDAQSEIFELDIDNTGFTAKDSGIGFRTRAEILEWFGRLGFEHNSDLHTTDGRFGYFGLGRAQIMAFAMTDWITNTFVMKVNIRDRGFDYDLLSDQPQSDGCTVKGQWYEELSFTDLKYLLQELEQLVAHMPTKVYINGKLINGKPMKWDVETDRILLKRRQTGDLLVYNQGVLVRSFPAYQYGSGIAVSKQPLRLNTARNDILVSKCKVWAEIQKFLRQDAVTASKAKPRLNDNERQMLIHQAVAGELSYEQVKDSPLIEDVTGRKWALKRIRDKELTVHTDGPQKLADRVHQAKQAFVISKRCMEMFGADKPADLIRLLETIFSEGQRVCVLKWKPIEELMDCNNDSYALLTEKELTKTEKVALRALSSGVGDLSYAVNYALDRERNTPIRKLYIGVSPHADGWTDGLSFIAIDRDFLAKNIRDGLRGFINLWNVITHELIHDANSSTSHGHDAEFYESFHDVLCDRGHSGYGNGLRLAMAYFLSRAQAQGIKLNRNELRDLDREASLDKDVYEREGIVKLMEEVETA